jgi:hypothetical protein
MHGKTYQTLPACRLCGYSSLEHARFCVLQHDRGKQLFIAVDPWSDRSDVFGPFAPQDVLRALRLACVRVPDGCELGPWQWGAHAGFRRTRLPFPDAEWTRLEPSWLPPSTSLYAPREPFPGVKWLGDADADADALDEVRRLASSVEFTIAGRLAHEWNVHPAGSMVLAGPQELTGDFAIVDLPPIP